MATHSESFSTYSGPPNHQMRCAFGSLVLLLKPRSLCRLLLGILLLTTFASVCFWVYESPVDVTQQVSGDFEVAIKERKRSEEPKAEPVDDRSDDLMQDYSTGTNSSYTAIFAAEVRALTESLPGQKVVLTTTNMGFLDFTENMLMSIDRLGSHPQVVAIAEDVGAYKALLRHKYGLHVLKPPDFDHLPQATGFGAQDVVKHANRRPAYLREFIRQGYEVLFVDSDTFWYKDPHPYFEGESFDVAFVRDRPRTFSDGVAFYRPTNRTEYFLRMWVWVLNTQPRLRRDDHALSYIIGSKLSPGLRVRALKSQHFPIYKNLYDSENDSCRNVTQNTVIFHAAFTPHQVNKRKVFEKCHIWLVNNTTQNHYIDEINFQKLISVS